MSPSIAIAHEKRVFASEIKFVVDAATAEQIRAWSRERLGADPNAGGSCGDTYRVTSIYYDTPDFAIFHRRGWFRHSKFRIRRYDSGVVFLERKLKVAGLVAKRRAAVMSPEIHPDQFPDHARWFAVKTAARRLQPICQVDYQRTARVASTPTGPIRVTLDEAIDAQCANEPKFRDRVGALRLTDEIVLELKFRRELPVLFRELVARFALNPRSFSKYRTAVAALKLAPVPAPAETAVREVASVAPLACPIS